MFTVSPPPTLPGPLVAVRRVRLNQRSGKANWLPIVIAVAVILVASWVVFNRQDDEGDKGGDGERGGQAEVTLVTYQQAVEAVAATEEGDFQRAMQLWSELIKTQPENNTFKLNQAIAILSWIGGANSEISSGQIAPERLAALQEELRVAYRLVEEVIKTLAASNIDDYRATFVEAALLEKKAQAEANSSLLLKQAADLLAKKLKEDKGQVLLAIKFDELAAQLENEYPELQADNADFLLDAFKRVPRNMFVLKRAAEVLMARQDVRLKELLSAMVELPRPMMTAPGMARNVQRVMPDKLVKDVAEWIDAGEWQNVRKLQLWLNTFQGMSGFLPDGKLARPDPLALLEVGFLAELANNLPRKTTAAELPLPSYINITLDAQASAAAWYDYDFDLDFDVAVTSGAKLLIYELSDQKWQAEPAVELELGFESKGILPVDLFEVDFPNRPKPPGSVAELMANSALPPTQELTDEQIAAAKRHNTLQELLLWGDNGIRIVTLDENERLALVETSTGLEDLGAVQSVVPIDFESDGDLDLAVLTAKGLRLMQNNGNRTFEDITEFSTLPAGGVALVNADFEWDTDQDFLMIDPAESNVVLLENILHNQFRQQTMTDDKWSLAPGANKLVIADLDGNSSWDVVSSGPDKSHVTYTLAMPNRTVAARNQVVLPLGGKWLAVEDLNNDGAMELVAAGDNGVLALRGLFDEAGGRSFAAEPTNLALGGQSISALSVIDANGDGMLELLTIANGVPVVSLATEPTDGQFVLARVRGVNDVNGGGRVNHFSVGSTLEIWADGEHFSRIVKHPVTHLGLGKRTPENLRIIFPNGLTQNLEDVDTNVLIEEQQIPRGSCPYAYGWNGEKFELITDCLWNAPLGLQIARDQVLPDRRWEHLLFPARVMQPREGMIELRITEELWEIAYFDYMRLTAIDHPAEVRVFTNEKVGPAQIAEHQVFAAQERLAPIAAMDSHGRNVLERIRAQDGVVVQAFDIQICQGLTEPHFVELDFGSLPTDKHALRLFLTGWMFPTDTSLNIGLDQNPERPSPEPPSLWVVDEKGDWVCAQPFMGFPGGKTKSIVIDLDGVFKSDDHRLRIGTSQQLYWDEAFVSWHAGDELIRQQTLEMASADLHYRGFSGLMPRQPDQPHWFDYDQVRVAPNWPSLEGPFTRFGDVKELLNTDDDRMVVIVSGDEITLKFTPPDEPLPSGWVRDYVLYSTGWDKDADLNTIEGQGSMPLPFMNQTAYPALLEQWDEAQEVWRKNADTLTRQHQIDPTKPRKSL